MCVTGTDFGRSIAWAKAQPPNPIDEAIKKRKYHNMSIILPPKRYQEDWDPKYDPIRHLPWFWTLHGKRERIPAVDAAAKLVGEGMTQVEAGSMLGVDVRDIRDFIAFKKGNSLMEPMDAKAYQMVIDQAYDMYRDSAGRKSFTDYICDACEMMGVNKRHVVEQWDVDPCFYPTHYKGVR